MRSRLWSSSLGTVLFGHGIVLAVLAMGTQSSLPPDPSPPILLDLAPAPATAPPEPAPAPPQLPQPVAPAPTPPKPAVRPHQPKVERRVPPPVPPPVPQPAPAAIEAPPAEPAPAAAPSPPPPPAPAGTPTPSPPVPVAGNPRAGASWQGRLLAHLERNKRYPDAAQGRGQSGTVELAFALDRNGMVVSSAIRNSSGSPPLDQAVLDMLRRAQPLPPPPPEITGDPVHLVMPVRFRLN